MNDNGYVYINLRRIIDSEIQKFIKLNDNEKTFENIKLMFINIEKSIDEYDTRIDYKTRRKYMSSEHSNYYRNNKYYLVFDILKLEFKKLNFNAIINLIENIDVFICDDKYCKYCIIYHKKVIKIIYKIFYKKWCAKLMIKLLKENSELKDGINELKNKNKNQF